MQALFLGQEKRYFTNAICLLKHQHDDVYDLL